MGASPQPRLLGTCNLDDLIGLELIANMDVLEALDAETALIAALDALDVVLEAEA